MIALVPTTSLGLRFDADVSSEDPEVVRRGEELLLDALDVTAEMGARYMCGILYSALGKYPAPCRALGYRNAVDAIKRVAKAARARGVTLGLEIVNRYETNVLNTAEQCVAFLEGARIDGWHGGAGLGLRLRLPPRPNNTVRLDVAFGDGGLGISAGWGEAF